MYFIQRKIRTLVKSEEELKKSSNAFENVLLHRYLDAMNVRSEKMYMHREHWNIVKFGHSSLVDVQLQNH